MCVHIVCLAIILLGHCARALCSGTVLGHQVWTWLKLHLVSIFGLTCWTLSLPRVINVKFLLQPHQKYYITQYEELGFSKLTRMKDDYTTKSHNLTYTFFSLKGWENELFELGSTQTDTDRTRTPAYSEGGEGVVDERSGVEGWKNWKKRGIPYQWHYRRFAAELCKSSFTGKTLAATGSWKHLRSVIL